VKVSAEEIARALNAKWHGSHWQARCPAHEDRNPSLSISEGENGVPLVHCFAGCTQDRLIAVLQARHLWPTPDTAPPSPKLRRAGPPKVRAGASHSTVVPLHPPVGQNDPPDFKVIFKREPADSWAWHDENGAVTGWTVRFDRPDGTKEAVKPLHWDGQRWAPGGFWPDGGPRPLFNLPELLARPNDPVLIVEGEKTAAAAAFLVDSHAVTTWPGGVNARAEVDWTILRGRAVTLWADADQPGRFCMADIGHELLRIGAASVHAVRVRGLPDKWDLADAPPDWLDIEKAIAEAIDLRAASIEKLNLRTSAAISATEYPDIRWAVPSLIPDGVTILAGPKSRGKSFLALDIALAVAAGGPALGSLQCEQGGVLYLALEDGERRIKGRQRAILQGAEPPAALDIALQWRSIDDGGLDDMELWIQARPGARLILVDVLAILIGAGPDRGRVYEQDYARMRPFIELTRRYPIALVLVHHTRKADDNDPVLRISGSLGMTGPVDTTLVLARNAGDPHGTLAVRGRDVPEREIALQFDPDTGRAWQLGAADDWRKSERRRQIIRALLDAGADGMTPAEIAETIGSKRGAIRYMLMQMKRSGEIIQIKPGLYTAE